MAENLSQELAEFDDYLRYGSDEELPKSELSRKAYCWTVSRLWQFLDGVTPSSDLARTFLKSLENEGNSARSINRHIWALRSYFNFRGQKFNIRGLKAQRCYPRFLDNEEWDTLVAAASEPAGDPNISEYGRRRAKRELALTYVYCGGGLRLSEAVQLRETDIFDEGFLRVMRKGGKEDIVPIEDEVLRILRDYLETRDGDGPYLFPGNKPGTAMAPRTAQGIIKALACRAGLQNVHVHTLRHTAGYQLRVRGAPERDIQDFLGHENIATTKIYTHLVQGELRARLPRRFLDARQGKLI